MDRKTDMAKLQGLLVRLRITNIYCKILSHNDALVKEETTTYKYECDAWCRLQIQLQQQ